MNKKHRLCLKVGVVFGIAVFLGAFLLFVQTWFDSKKNINQLLGFVLSDTTVSVDSAENKKTAESVPNTKPTQTKPTALKTNQLNSLITLGASSKVALIRLEDVGPGGKYATLEDLGRFRAIIDYLYSEGIPFHVAVIPRFKTLNPDGNWFERGIDDAVLAPETEAFIRLLYYIRARGGVLGLHGYTHQYGEVKRPDNYQDTGIGDEFAVSGALKSNTLSYAQERFELSLKAFEKVGLTAHFWETPHNVATQEQKEVFRSGIGIQYEYYQKHDKEPVYLEYQNQFRATSLGSVYIPTPLYYVEGGTNSLASVDSLLKRVPNCQCPASFFYHPFLEYPFLEPVLDNSGKPVVEDGLPLFRYAAGKRSYLRQLVEGFKASGYRFGNIHEVVPFTPGHRVQLSVYPGKAYYLLNGDVDANDRAELIQYNGKEVAVIAYNNQLPRYRSQISQTVWLKLPEDFAGSVPLVGDFNGDACDDLVFYSREEGNWWVVLSKGDKYASPKLWLTDWGRGGGLIPHIGDFNGDGKSDLLLYSPKDHTCQIALAEQKNFNPQSEPYREIDAGDIIFAIGDANGDAKNDLYFYHPSRGSVQVALSQGQTFTEPRTWLKGWITGNDFLVGDVNGDSRTDVILRSPVNGIYFIAISADNRFIPQTFSFGPWAAGTHRRVMLADFDGNGRDDLASWYQSGAFAKAWVDLSYSFQSSGSSTEVFN